MGVAAEATTSFNKKKTTLKKSEYVKDIREVKTGTAVWAIDESEFYEYLTENFKQDVISLEPEELFEKYGTHFLRSVVLGGRLELNASIEADSNEDLNKAVANFKTTLDGTLEQDSKAKENKDTNTTTTADDGSTGAKTNIHAEVDSQNDITFNEIKKYATIDLSSKCYGGEAKDFTTYVNTTARGILSSDTNLGADIYGGNTSLGNAYAQWLTTVRTRPALVDIYDKDSLYPIWDLLDYFVDNDDSLNEEYIMERKEELKAAFEKYGKDNYDKIMNNVDNAKNNSLYAIMVTTVTGVKEGYKLGNVVVTNAANNEDGSMTANADSMKVMYQVNQDLDMLPVGTSDERTHTIMYDTHYLGSIKGYGKVIDKWMAKEGAYYVQVIYKDQTSDSSYNNNVFKNMNKNDAVVLYETDPAKVEENGGIDKINVLVIYETMSTSKYCGSMLYNWLEEGSVVFK